MKNHTTTYCSCELLQTLHPSSPSSYRLAFMPLLLRTLTLSHTQVISLFHASIAKAFCTVKRSHTVITFVAQPFHWGETERRGEGRNEAKRRGERVGKKRKHTQRTRVKQRARENNKGTKQAWEKK